MHYLPLVPGADRKMVGRLEPYNESASRQPLPEYLYIE
jgi:hypothetical protein